MLRNIIVCRHAEAGFYSSSLGDFGRPLTATGQDQARLAGQWLRELRPDIGAFVSSPAVRAKDTARILAEGLGFPENRIAFKPEIYHAPVGGLMEEMAALGQEVRGVVLVGHNPAVSALSSQLGDDEGIYLDPANIVVMYLDLENWAEIFYRQGRCQAHFRPPRT